MTNKLNEHCMITTTTALIAKVIESTNAETDQNSGLGRIVISSPHTDPDVRAKHIRLLPRVFGEESLCLIRMDNPSFGSQYFT